MSNEGLPQPDPHESALAARELELFGKGVPMEFFLLAARVRQSRDEDPDFPHVRIRNGVIGRAIREARAANDQHKYRPEETE